MSPQCKECGQKLLQVKPGDRVLVRDFAGDWVVGLVGNSYSPGHDGVPRFHVSRPGAVVVSIADMRPLGWKP